MKQITTHHDGFGLNESISVVAVDEPGPGGAHHRYLFDLDVKGEHRHEAGYLQFQRGPRNETESVPGVTEGAVLAVVIDRLESFQAGEYACEENAEALRCLHDALDWMRLRTHRRAERGVLGTYER